jgi:antitoxin component of MazEF toxin-antitoxin module
MPRHKIQLDESQLPDEGSLVLKATRPHYRLEDLVKGITEKNRHPEIDFGPPQGREIL